MLYFEEDAATGQTHLLNVVRRPRWLQRWERLRHGKAHLLIELLVEFIGVYFFVYCGVGANLVYNMGKLGNDPGRGLLLTVGFGYALGVVFAIAIAGPAGGHFNPCVTISHAVWHSFRWKKVIPLWAHIALACLFMGRILNLENALMLTGKYDTVQFTPDGIAGCFGLYTHPRANLRDAFMNEFFTDFFLALIIWGVLDSTNFFTPPAAAPWLVGFAYGVTIWDFAPGGLAANSARDVGGRLMALSIWGTRASGGKYAAIAALTKIPATLFATLVYELIFTDSSRVLSPEHRQYMLGHKAHLNHRDMGQSKRNHLNSSSEGSAETAHIEQTA